MFRSDFDIKPLVGDFENWNQEAYVDTKIIGDYVNSMHFTLKHLESMDNPEDMLMFREDCQAELENYYELI